MLIFNRNTQYNFFSKIIAIICQVLTLFLITSCSLQYSKHQQLKEIIIPKGIHFPPRNKEYYIPYTQKDLDKKNYNIFPPV